jgi:medium-chain acyl-[acyl-carrier-protein] hydrolase
MLNPSPWLVKLGGGAEAALNLFAFPYSGGSAASYARWRNWLPKGLALYGVQLPGRGRRMEAPLVSDMDQLVALLLPELLPRLRQAYLLYGHSNGALMAFAVLNRLLQAGARPPEAVILSGKRSPTVPRAAERLGGLSDRDLLQKLKDLNGTPPALLANPAVMRMFFPAIRADFAIGDSHVLRAVHPALRGVPALILAGADDHIAVEDVFAWTELFADARTMTLAGDHFFIHGNPAFAQALREFCQQVCATQPSLETAEP